MQSAYPTFLHHKSSLFGTTISPSRLNGCQIHGLTFEVNFCDEIMVLQERGASRRAQNRVFDSGKIHVPCRTNSIFNQHQIFQSVIIYHSFSKNQEKFLNFFKIYSTLTANLETLLHRDA